MSFPKEIIVRGFSRQQDNLLADAMDLVARNASREELLKFFVNGFVNQSTCDAAMVLESQAPDELRHRAVWQLRGVCQSGVPEPRWRNFCGYLESVRSAEHWIAALAQRKQDAGMISFAWGGSDIANSGEVFSDIRRVVDGQTSNSWLSILRLPAPSASHPTRFFVAIYNAGVDEVPRGGEQDWRLLELFRRVYNLALADLRQKAKQIIDHRREIMRDLAPSIIHHEINSRIVNSVRTLEVLSGFVDHVDVGVREDFSLLFSSLSRDVESLKRITHAVMGLERKPGNEVVCILDELLLLRDLTAFRLNKIGGLLKIDCHPDIKVVSSSALLLHILLNLINNAVDAMAMRKEKEPMYTPEISIRVSEWHTSISGKQSKQPGVAITVEDNGPGVTSLQYGRLFDLGYTTKKSGHGLGLPISRLLAGFLGGTLDPVRKQVTAGCVFQLVLPAEAPVSDAIEQQLEELLNA